MQKLKSATFSNVDLLVLARSRHEGAAESSRTTHTMRRDLDDAND